MGKMAKAAEAVLVPVAPGDMPHLLWALDLAQHNARFFREAKLSTENERTLGKLRGDAVARLQSNVLEAGDWD